MANPVGKVIKTIAKAPGAVVGFTGATALGVVGGAIKSTGQGIASGVKAAGNLKTKILGEAAEEVIKDTAEVASKNSDDIQKIIKPAKNYKQRTEFGSADGTRYRMREVDGQKIYESKAKDGNWDKIQTQGHTKASKIYGQAKEKYIAYNDSLAEEASKFEQQVAEDIAKTAPGDGAGFNLKQFASDHPVGTALAGLGVGMGVHALFDDD